MPLLPAVEISGSHQHNEVRFEGKTYKGPMVADSRGIGIDFSTSSRQGLKKMVTHRRTYLLEWSTVQGYDVSYKPGFQGSTMLSTVDLIVHCSDRDHAFHLATDETTLRNRLERARSGILT